MSEKRRQAQHAPGRVEARVRAAALEPSCARAAEAASASIEPEGDVIPWLRKLGFRADEARRAASRCEGIPEASLEERVRFALSLLGPPCRRVERSQVTAT